MYTKDLEDGRTNHQPKRLVPVFQPCGLPMVSTVNEHPFGVVVVCKIWNVGVVAMESVIYTLLRSSHDSRFHITVQVVSNAQEFPLGFAAKSAKRPHQTGYEFQYDMPAS